MKKLLACVLSVFFSSNVLAELPDCSALLTKLLAGEITVAEIGLEEKGYCAQVLAMQDRVAIVHAQQAKRNQCALLLQEIKDLLANQEIENEKRHKEKMNLLYDLCYNTKAKDVTK